MARVIEPLLFGSIPLKTQWEWWPGTESNRRHGDFQSPALPTELPGHDVAAGRRERPRITAARRCGVKGNNGTQHAQPNRKVTHENNPVSGSAARTSGAGRRGLCLVRHL